MGKLDPSQKKTFTRTDGEVGAIMAWMSTNENVGEGEQEIVKMIPNKQIDFVFYFKKPMESDGRAQMIFDGTLGPKLQEGLDNLKGILDKK